MEAKFRELEGADVDDDLAKMKAALGSGKVKGEVSQGRPLQALAAGLRRSEP